MVEPGSFPTPESDDLRALNQDAAGPQTEAEGEDLDPAALDVEQPAIAEADSAADSAPEAKPEPSGPGALDRLRATALGAGSWGVERAGLAAGQAATLARAYPRASLASGLSVLILGGVLAFTPSKKTPTVELPNPDAAPQARNEPDAVDPNKPSGPGGSNEPEQAARADEPPAASPSAAEPGALARDDEPAAGDPTPKPPHEDPAIAEAPAPGDSPLTAPAEALPAAPSESVKLTGGVADPSLPALPAVDPDAGDPSSKDASGEPSPIAAPAPAIAEAGPGPAIELARADVKPGSPPPAEAAPPAPAEPDSPAPLLPVADQGPAPASTPDEAGPALGPEAAPSNPAPEPTPALETSPAEPPAVAPRTDQPPAPDVGAGSAPAILPSAPDPTAAAAPPAAAEASPSLAAPAAATAASAPTVKGAAGLLGLGAGLGAAVKGLADKAAEPRTPDAPEAKPAPDATEAKPAPSPATSPSLAAQEAPHAPEPQPSRAPDPIPSASSPPAAAPASGDFPSFREVPEGSASPAVATSAPAAAAKAEPNPISEEAPDHRELTPIRRSGRIVINDIGADPVTGGDPFDRRDDGLDAATDASFDVETLPRRGQDAGSDAGPAKASPKAASGGDGKLDTVLHKVESGENFFSISKSYYSSGRYYRALSHANKYKDPRELHVGAVIRVPPPEDLDPAYIDPPGTRYGPRISSSGGKAAPAEASSKAAAATPIRRSRRSEIELNLPASDPAAERASDEGRVAASRRDLDRDDDFDRPEPEAASRNVSTRPVHKVRPDETLRTIARDRLGSGRRANEILELNRDTIDDPSELIVGQVLQLPEDATRERPRSRR